MTIDYAHVKINTSQKVFILKMVDGLVGLLLIVAFLIVASGVIIMLG